MVDGDGLENRCTKVPGVRIPLSPPNRALAVPQPAPYLFFYKEISELKMLSSR